ncbi:pyridoxamine 5'-phosphate oxidase family protein [Janibacter massiliensis]|uniref:pyridoxamine 5'-phosphate oxidase family protein n=1 Tax=Janibacter massiliensis TaxID=2058291 RepID=UPI000D10CC46|nr:pyridoxamine 5'-phosphate oxidase family protein [Janibacter massiliensis]
MPDPTANAVTEPAALGRLTRKPARGEASRAELDALLDEVLVGTLSTVVDGWPWAVPLLLARDGDRILLHGSSGAGALRHVAAGAPACLTVTSIDGIVVAASTFDSSANYRSAVVRGRLEELRGEEAWTALARLSDRIIPARTGEVRDMTAKEVGATVALALPIEDGGWLLKTRTGGVGTEPVQGVWQGVVPLRTVAGDPVSEPGTDAPVPASVDALRRRYR